MLQVLDERSDDVFGVYGHVRNSFLERWSYDLLASNMVKCKKTPRGLLCPPGAGTRRRILILQPALMGQNMEKLMLGIGFFLVVVMAECFTVILGDVFQRAVCCCCRLGIEESQPS